MTALSLLGALTWEPNVKGGLYVLIAFVILVGSPFLILSTNSGARLGFLLAGAGLFGWMTILAATWWVYGIGPKGDPPTWEPQTTVSGQLAEVGSGVLAGFPKGWHDLDLTDKAVADAQPVVDGVLVPAEGKGRFESNTQYLLVHAAETGGEKYGPFHLLNFRPLNLFHKIKYLTVTVQPVKHQATVPGAAPPKAVVDPAATPVSVVMVRNLGSLREKSGVVAFSSLLLFGLFVYQLHVRDKDTMMKDASATAKS